MLLKDLLKSITKDLKYDYWLHVFKGGEHIGTIEFNYNGAIRLNSINNNIIKLLDCEVKEFEIFEEWEFNIILK